MIIIYLRIFVSFLPIVLKTAIGKIEQSKCHAVCTVTPENFKVLYGIGAVPR